MTKFRKKPVMAYGPSKTIVEAEQFLPDKPLPFSGKPVVAYNGRFYVETIHGERAYLEPGDWVILEPRGIYNAYPCKPDIFEATYEPVEAHE